MTSRHFARGIVVSVVMATGLAALMGCPNPRNKGPIDLIGLGVPEIDGKSVDPWARKYSADADHPRLCKPARGRPEPLPSNLQCPERK